MSELTHDELKEVIAHLERDYSVCNREIPALGKLFDMLYDAFAETSANTDKIVKFVVTTHKIPVTARFSVHHAVTGFFFDGKHRKPGYYLVAGLVFLPRRYDSRRQAEAVRSRLNGVKS